MCLFIYLFVRLFILPSMTLQQWKLFHLSHSSQFCICCWSFRDLLFSLSIALYLINWFSVTCVSKHVLKLIQGKYFHFIILKQFFSISFFKLIIRIIVLLTVSILTSAFFPLFLISDFTPFCIIKGTLQEAGGNASCPFRCSHAQNCFS